MLARMFKDVLSGKRILLVSDYASANMVFLYEVALKLVSEKHKTIGLVEGLPLRLDLLEDMASSKGLGRKVLSHIVVLKPGFKPTIPVLVYGADAIDFKDLVKASSKIAFATAYRQGRLPRLLRARVARLTRIDDEYILRYGYGKCRVWITNKGVELVSGMPKGIIGRALEEIVKAIAEYGPITHRDAVYVLTGSLGIDRRYAQYLLRELVFKRYVRVEGGYIIVEDYST